MVSFVGGSRFQCFSRLISLYSLYDTEKYYRFVELGEDNTDAEGRPRDSMKKEVEYSCPDCGGKPRGYKDHFSHMATEHGVLGDVLRAHAEVEPAAEPVLARYLEGWRKFKGKTEEGKTSPSLGCRARGCSFTAESTDDLKRHYSLRHYRSHFTEVLPGAAKPKVPVPAGERGVPCKLCPKNEKGKMARIPGTRDEVLVHLAVAHDKLYSALRDAANRRGDREASMAIRDLYPDKAGGGDARETAV